MDPYKRDRRLGRWFVNEREVWAVPSLIDEIQQHATVLQATPSTIKRAIEFIGRSEHFDIVGPGDVIPEYRPIFEAGPAGMTSFRWERA